jgi:hypothetical protein
MPHCCTSPHLPYNRYMNYTIQWKQRRNPKMEIRSVQLENLLERLIIQRPHTSCSQHTCLSSKCKRRTNNNLRNFSQSRIHHAVQGSHSWSLFDSQFSRFPKHLRFFQALTLSALVFFLAVASNEKEMKHKTARSISSFSILTMLASR